MGKKFFDYIIHGGDYNPDQWIRTPEIWDEDMRLMKLAHINSATIGIFSWATLEPEEGVYNFEWLDTILDKMHENGISAILATPSGARPAWLAEKYPEVLRVDENGIRNEFGERHNHCLTSPVYREKVRNINRKLAERYKNHPAVKMWHISNEYSGECHCELCRASFRDWLKEYYHNDIDELNFKWWNGFWSHTLNNFDQINPPEKNGEDSASALNLAWQRFITDSHISFFENEIAPLRERKEDIEELILHFANRYAMLFKKDFWKIPDAIMERLKQYPWPGNVRELENVTEFMINMMGPDGILSEDTLPQELLRNTWAVDAPMQEESPVMEKKVVFDEEPIIPLKEVEIREIRRAIEKYGVTTQGKRTAAKELGIGLATLYRKLEELDI